MSLFTGARRQFSTYVGAGTVLNSRSYHLFVADWQITPTFSPSSPEVSVEFCQSEEILTV
jgi:hypothetical protein